MAVDLEDSSMAADGSVGSESPLDLKLVLERDLCAMVLRGGPEHFELAAEHVTYEAFDGGTWRRLWKAMAAVVASKEPWTLGAVGLALKAVDDLKAISYRDYSGVAALFAIHESASELPASAGSQARSLAWAVRERRGSEARIKAGARLRQGDDIAEVFRELKAETLPPPDKKDDRGPWNWVSAAELAEELPPITWLCEGLRLAPGAAVCFAGYGYSRKTLAAQALGVAVMAGTLVWDVFRVGTGRLVHLDYEQGRRLTHARYQRLARMQGVDFRSLGDVLRLACLPPLYLDATGADDHLARLCDGATLLLVDSFRAAYPSAEENSSEVRKHIDMLSRVSERTGCTSIFIHHARKPSDDAKGGAKMSIRGSAAIFDACASVFVFSGEKDTPTLVQHEKERIGGLTLEDFGIDAEDVDINGVHHAGLRVVHLEKAQLEARAKGCGRAAERSFDAYVNQVLEGMKRRPGCAGNVLYEDVGGRKSRFLTALETLESSGRAVQRSDPGARWATWRAV